MHQEDGYVTPLTDDTVGTQDSVGILGRCSSQMDSKASTPNLDFSRPPSATRPPRMVSSAESVSGSVRASKPVRPSSFPEHLNGGVPGRRSNSDYIICSPARLPQTSYQPSDLPPSCSRPNTPVGKDPPWMRPPLLKSVSTNYLSCSRQSVQKPLRLARSSTDRPVVIDTGCRCHCQCDGFRKQPSIDEASTFDGDGITSEGLSWRRLHMSRAKLKATATTSELLSGFAMVAMVELQINEPTKVPEWLFVIFSVCTTVLVAVHIFALMISTYLLPNIDAVSKLQVHELVGESPHERMRGFIELAWAFSTILGLFLFLVEVAILCWVKFWDYSFTAAWAATIIVIPVLIVFVAFAVHFYHKLVVHKCESTVADIKELENMKRQLDSHSNV